MSASERGNKEKRGEDASGAALRRSRATREEPARNDDLAGALSDSFSRLEQRLENLASAFDDQPAPALARRTTPRSARLDAALAEITSRQRALDEEPAAAESKTNGHARPRPAAQPDEAPADFAPTVPAKPRQADPGAAAERNWRLPTAPIARPEFARQEFARVRDRFARGPEADNLARLERQLQSLASYMADPPARVAPTRPVITEARRASVEEEIRAIAPRASAERRPPRAPEGERDVAEPVLPRQRPPAPREGEGEVDGRLGRVVEELARTGRMIQSGNFSAAEHAAALDGKIATLTRVVQEIGERIDRLAETAAPDHKTLESLRGSIQEIRARATSLAGGDGAALGAIRTALDGIVERLERLPAIEPERYAHAVREEVTSVGERLIDAVRAELQRPNALTQRDDSMREAVERLARRLERAEERTHFDPSATVEAALERFAQRLEPTTAPAVLSRLERGILDILRQIEDGRALANESVEAIAARAVRTTLAALQGAQLDQPGSSALVRELADLRGMSEDNQRRIVDALAGVRDALERVTDRLAERPVQATEAAAPTTAPAAEDATAEDEDEHQTITERARAAAIEAADEAEREGTLAPVYSATDEETFPPRPADPTQERAQLIAAARRALMESEIERSRAERGEERVREPLAIQGANDNVGTRRGVRRFAIGLAAALVLAGSWQVGRILTSRHALTATAQAPSAAGEQLAAAEVHPDAAADVAGKDNAHAPAETTAAASATAKARETGATAPEATSEPAPAPQTASVTTEPVTASAATDTAPAAPAPAAEAAARAADPVVTASLPAAPLPAANPEAPVPIPAPAPANPPAATGASHLFQRAGAGDAAAQYEIAERYYDGRGLKHDAAKAAEWFARAAKQGLVPAEYRLGALYEKGIGIGKDASKAREWYEKAADRGNVRAMHNLGVLYADGALGKPDFAQAARWFRKAADYGLKDSQYNLGVLYARGLAVAQNLPEAYLWFSLAADQGDKDAGSKRDEIAKKMTARQLSTAKVAAGTWQAKKPIVAANEVPVPAGGWDHAPATARAK